MKTVITFSVLLIPTVTLCANRHHRS